MIFAYYTQAGADYGSASDQESLIRRWAAELPADKAERILRLRQPQGRLNSALGWQLLKYALRQSGYPDFRLDQLLFDGNRKPRWPHHACDFNLSHSESLLICVLSDYAQVGVDVEHTRPLRDQRLFAQILAPQEALPAKHDTGLFFRYWTQKEAIIKADGNGGVWDMPKINLQKSPIEYNNRHWYLYPINTLPGFACHVAADRPDETVRVEPVTAARILATDD